MYVMNLPRINVIETAMGRLADYLDAPGGIESVLFALSIAAVAASILSVLA